MPTIDVTLPDDRRNTGEIRVLDDQGNTIAGPFEAYGRADRGEAARHGNGTGSPDQPMVDPTQGWGDG